MDTLDSTLAALAGLTESDELTEVAPGRHLAYIGGTTQIWIEETDDGIVDLVFPIDLPQPFDYGLKSVLQVLLTANSLGVGSGRGKIALDNDLGKPVLVESIDWRDLDEAQLEARLFAFLRQAAIWTSDRLAELFESVAEDEPLKFDPDLLFVRI